MLLLTDPGSLSRSVSFVLLPLPSFFPHLTFFFPQIVWPLQHLRFFALPSFHLGTLEAIFNQVCTRFSLSIAHGPRVLFKTYDSTLLQVLDEEVVWSRVLVVFLVVTPNMEHSLPPVRIWVSSILEVGVGTIAENADCARWRSRSQEVCDAMVYPLLEKRRMKTHIAIMDCELATKFVIVLNRGHGGRLIPVPGRRGGGERREDVAMDWGNCRRRCGG